jgi:autotransporter-associated beta strand protein
MKTLNQFRQQLRRILSAQRFLFDSCTGKMKGPFRLVSGSYLVGLVAATLLLMGSSAQAADYTWNTTNATWNTTATNWTGSGGGTNPWDITNGATNNATFTVSGANTVTVSGIVYANQITKTDSAGITTLSSGTITLAGSAPSITNNGTSGLTISSKISGSNGVVVTLGSGASTTGSVTFSGANDYTGTTTINGANNGLTISNNAGLGTSAVLVNANGILKVSTSSLSNNITLNGGASNGAIQASANSTLSGLITLASNVTIGNRATSNSTLTLSGGINTTGGANQTLTLNILASSTAINNAITINSTSVNLGTGGILDIGAGIQSTGTGTVNLNVGNNTWGTIIVRAVSTAGVSSNSTLNLGAANALGGSGAVLQLGNSNIALEGITVNLNGNNQTIGGLRSFGSTGSASANGTRTVTSAAAATLTIDNSSATNYLYDGAISGAISVTKNGTATQTLSGNNTYTGATTVNAGTLLLSGNGTLGTSTISLTGGTLDMGGKSLTNTFGSLTGGTLSNGTLTNNGSNYDLQSGIVSAVLAGTNGVNKTTSSTVTLAGANTYTGATTITGGTLSIAAISNGGVAGALGNSTNAAANLVLGGGTLEYTGSANGSTDRNFTLTAATTSGISVSNSTVSLTISGAAAATTGALTKEGAGMLILSGNNTYTGTTTINAGTLQFNSSGQLGGGNYSQNITNNGTLLYSGSNNQTLSGVISGTGALTQNNSSTLTLSGSNTYTGNTTVSAGILNIQHANALGGSANGTIVANGAVLQLQGGITIASEILTLNGSGVSNGGALINSSGNNEWAGNIAIGSATTRIQGTSGNLAISGNISNNAGAQLVFQGSNITVSGIISGNGTLTGGSGLTGLLTLNGNNTYTGASSLTAGTISINSLKDEGVASSLGANGTIQMGASSTTILRYTGAGDTSNRIIDLRGTTGGATIDQSGTGTLRLTSDFTATGAGSKTLTLQGSTVGIGEIAGAVINNNATNTTSLTKTGTGTWILSGANTYTGATMINAGTLQIGNGSSSGSISASSAITNNATLVFNRLGTVTQGTDFANSITGTGNLTQAGSGTLFLGGTNSYAGLTTISAGSLSISSVSALGSTSGVSLANATALIYTGGTASLDRAISVTSGTGTIRNTGGALTLTGGLSKNGTTLTFDSGTFHVNSAIIGPAANSDLIVDGATVTLNAANTYNGPTFIIDGGTLTANVTGALPTSTRTAISIDATGTGSSTLALGANQSIASLAGNTTSTVALGSSTLTINSTSGSTTYAGRITGGASSALVKEGASTQVLSGNNSAFTGSTTVNSGTLQASAAGALGGTSNIDINGGSFLVAAANAVNDNANINIKGGTLAVSGDFNETVGALTLSANSIIDLNGFSGILRFSGLSWAGTAPNATLAIWNWSGTPQHGAPVNDYTNPSHVVFTSDANLTPENLAKISFYSGNGIGFVGNAFEQSFTQSGFATGTEIIAVPEPETYLIGVLLIFGFTIYQLRRSKIWAIVPHGPNFSSEAPEPLPETIPPKNRPTHTPRADTPN